MAYSASSRPDVHSVGCGPAVAVAEAVAALQVAVAAVLIQDEPRDANLEERPEPLHDFEILDWTDAAVSHPFVDLATYLFRTQDHAARRQMRDAYLSQWAADIAPAALAEAGDLALVVGCLYQVDTYRRLVAAMDPDDSRDMQGDDAIWLRKALAIQAVGIDFARLRSGS